MVLWRKLLVRPVLVIHHWNIRYRRDLISETIWFSECVQLSSRVHPRKFLSQMLAWTCRRTTANPGNHRYPALVLYICCGPSAQFFTQIHSAWSLFVYPCTLCFLTTWSKSLSAAVLQKVLPGFAGFIIPGSRLLHNTSHDRIVHYFYRIDHRIA